MFDIKIIFFALFGFSIAASAVPSNTSPTHGTLPINGENEIGWVLLNFPPLMKVDLNREGEVDLDRASGPLAEIQRELIKALPQYKHRFQMVSFLRAQKLFESHGHYCTILFLETPDRAEYLYFGDTIATAIPPGLVVSKNSENLIKQHTTAHTYVDLQGLLQRSDFQLGVVNGRSFSGKIDAAMVNSKKPIFKLVANQATGNLFKMVESQRVDGVLSYYLELAEEQERNPRAADLRFYQLKQDHTSISLPASCEKSNWGRATLEKISLAVKDEAVKAKLTALSKQTLLLDRPKRSEEPSLLR